jgi:VIT1/CCC1 family predicted Fe2+/Mn2+ transporter
MADPTPEPRSIPVYEPHVGLSRQYWRDIILGVNDGLVSVFLLVAGVVGGGLDTDGILLTALAGAVAGAISMAAGEYLATKSQDEVFDSEIALEKSHIIDFRDRELAQLRGFFADMGVVEEDLDGVVAAFNRSDQALLNAMAALEFGAVESERRSPYMAMAASGLLFLAGSLTSVVPFLFAATPGQGFLWSAVLTAIGLFIVGVVKTRVTRTNPITSGLENLVIAGLGGIVAWYVGGLVGSSV